MNLVPRLLAEINKNHQRIVVCGDAMLDHWIHGDLAQCQDGCVKFVQNQPTITTPGGAANAANSLKHWDVPVDLFCLPVVSKATHKWRFIANGEIVYRWDDEPTEADRRTLNYQWSHSQALEVTQHTGAVLLSDYDKGYLTPDFIRAMVKVCAEQNVPCVADCKRAPEVYAGCVLKCNFKYSMEWAHQSYIVTNGDGLPFVNGNFPFDILRHQPPPVKCINHVGAGDCFAAHLALGLAYGFSLKEAAALAHSAGRVYVQHPYNRAPTPQEIAKDLEQSIAPSPAQDDPTG